MEHLLLSILLSILLPAAILGGSVYYLKRARDRRLALWRDLAARHGGSLHTGSGVFSAHHDLLLLPIDGVTVGLDIHVVSHGKSSTTYQRAIVLAPPGSTRSAQIYKETPLFSALGKALGGQDIQVGDPDFDGAFIIKGDNAAWLQRALTRGTRRAHLADPYYRVALTPHAPPALGPGLRLRRADKLLRAAAGDPIKLLQARVILGDGVLTVTRVGPTSDAASVLAQMRLAAAYARDLLDLKPAP